MKRSVGKLKALAFMWMPQRKPRNDSDLLGPEGNTANVPAPDTKGRMQRSCVYALICHSSFGSTRTYISSIRLMVVADRGIHAPAPIALFPLCGTVSCTLILQYAYFSTIITMERKSTRWNRLFGNCSTQIRTLREEQTAVQTGDWLSRVITAAQRVYEAQQTCNRAIFKHC